MDSIAVAYWMKPSYSITIDYGQKPAKAEIQAASEVSRLLNMDHHVISVDCSSLGSGDLNGNKSLSIAPVKEWWPFRNQLLVTLASMKAVSLGLNELIVGSVATDGVHTDGTLGFYTMMSELTQFQEGEVSIVCPAINLKTTELIKEVKLPHSLLLWAHSCHTSSQPCMNCNGCLKYLYVLQEIGLD